MKIMVVSPTPSHPQNAGNRLRIFKFLKKLQSFGHFIHFVHIDREQASAEDEREMMIEWDAYHSIPYDRALEKRTLGDVYGIDDWCNANIESYIANLLKKDSYDAVIVNYVFFSKVLELFPKDTVKIVDTHDVFADRHKRLEAMGLPRSFFYTTKNEERRGLSRADLVLAIQEDEAEYYRSYLKKPVIVVGHAIDSKTRNVAPSVGNGAPLRVGYIGSSNPINVTSIQSLLDSCAKRKDVSNLKFVVAGSAGKELKIPASLDVELMGEVDQVSDFYDNVDVVVNPSVGGTGLKIKTVEALEFGLPLLCTVSGSDGMGATSRFHLAKNTDDLAKLLAEVGSGKALADCHKESTEFCADYNARIEETLKLFSDKELLLSKKTPPSVVIVSDIRFWRRGLGKEARLFELINEISKHALVQMFFLGSLWRQEYELIEACNVNAEVFSATDFVPKDYKIIQPVGGLSPFERRRFDSKYFQAFENFIAQHPCDVMIVEYIMMSFYRAAKGAPAFKIIDTHDVMSLRVQTFNRIGIPHFLQISMKEELDILNKFNISLAIQQEEYEFLKSVFGETRAAYIPHGVSKPITEFAPDPVMERYENDPEIAKTKGRRIVFVGGDSPMNIDGIKWFLRECWPAVRLSGAHLFVVGAVCNALEEFKDDDQLHLLGRINELDRVYAFCDIGINPTYYGGGLKIKTVEYLASGLATVVTPQGARGIPDIVDKAMVVATNRAEFIAATMRMVLDKNLRQEYSDGARKLAETEYSGRQARSFSKTLGYAL